MDIIGYLESVAGRPQMREDGHAHVLAVDAPYGEGKSFFLRRFAKQMALSHPVAFVDAWTDDLEDEPLVALAATLEAALEPLIAGNEKLKTGLADFRAKAGKVAKIVAYGAAKRGLGFLISHAGAELLTTELANASDAVKDIDRDSIKSGPQAIIDELAVSFGGSDGSIMQERIERFNEGKAAIAAMKSSLANIVASLTGPSQPPIVIVVDELDRCRPTYAIKLLEEVKHLFDVDGVVFVLGMHGEQLTHSVAAAYGSGFDAASYLKRFISRRYTLKGGGLFPLLEKINLGMGLSLERLAAPNVMSDDIERPYKVPALNLLAAYMDAYGLVARDAFEIMDILQTCLALTPDVPLLVPYLLPLIIKQMSHDHKDLPDMKRAAPWKYALPSENRNSLPIQLTLEELGRQFHIAQAETDDQLHARFNKGGSPYAYRKVAELLHANLPIGSYGLVRNYPKLLMTVARFTSKPIEVAA
jgi:hypothetical protein